MKCLQTNRWIIPIFGFVIAALVLTRRIKLIPKMIVGAVLILLTGSIFGLASGADPIVGLAMLIDPDSTLMIVLYCILEAFALLLAWREPQTRLLAVFLYLCVAISAFPVITVLQGNNHMLYLANAFQSTLFAAIAVAAGRQVKIFFNKPKLVAAPASP